MQTHTEKTNKYELKDQCYPYTPTRLNMISVIHGKVFTKFTLYAPFNNIIFFTNEFYNKGQ